MGKIPDMPIVPSRMLLTVKVDSEGKFTKCKTRQVLSGHKGFVKPTLMANSNTKFSNEF
jgi:hypothetical protein